MDDAQAKLIAEQLGRMRDSINARLDAIEERIKHHTELDGERVRSVREELAALRRITEDHEGRLRSATDGVTTFKTWAGLASGGSSIFSVIALIKSFFGG